MTRLSLFSFVFLFLLSSCCDDPIIADGGISIPDNYIPMAVGNYWVYQVLTENEEGDLIVGPQMDSIAIVGTELINDIEHYKFESTRPENTYYRREENGYLLDEEDRIYFSPKSDEGIISTFEVKNGEELLLTFEYSMVEGDQNITVPTGTYTTRSIAAFVTPSPSFDDTYSCDKTPQEYFAPNIGLVRKDEHYSTGCRSQNKELVRFNIN